MRVNVQKNQAGIGTVAVIAAVVAVLVIVAAGWLVYQKRQNKSQDTNTPVQSITNFDECVAAGNPVMETYPEQCAANGQTFTRQVTASGSSQPADETTSWLLYESPGKEYTVRLADGWQLERYQKSSSIYTYDNHKLALQTGTKAVVTEVDGGKDGSTGLFINYATQNIDQIVTPGKKQISLKTNDGLEIEKYYWIISGYSDEGLGAGNGDTQYTYVIRKSSSQVMTIGYTFAPGSTDYHDVVEKVIQTIHIN